MSIIVEAGDEDDDELGEEDDDEEEDDEEEDDEEEEDAAPAPTMADLMSGKYVRGSCIPMDFVSHRTLIMSFQ